MKKFFLKLYLRYLEGKIDPSIFDKKLSLKIDRVISVIHD